MFIISTKLIPISGEAEVSRIWAEIGQSHKMRKLTKESLMQMREIILDYFVTTLKLNAAQKAAYEAMMQCGYEHFLKGQGM